jgi:hypothetical protein
MSGNSCIGYLILPYKFVRLRLRLAAGLKYEYGVHAHNTAVVFQPFRKFEGDSSTAIIVIIYVSSLGHAKHLEVRVLALHFNETAACRDAFRSRETDRGCGYLIYAAIPIIKDTERI